jgi:hypothetical protein
VNGFGFLSDVLSLVIGLVVMAALMESGLEYLVVLMLKEFAPGVGDSKRELVVKLIAAAVGIFGCAVFSIDVLSQALDFLSVVPAYPPLAHWFGVVLTGFLVARGAQGIHDFAVKHLGLDGGSLPPIEDAE